MTTKCYNDGGPGHAAVDGKVDRVGEADEGVDDQHDVLCHVVVKKSVETEKKRRRICDCK